MKTRLWIIVILSACLIASGLACSDDDDDDNNNADDDVVDDDTDDDVLDDDVDDDVVDDDSSDDDSADDDSADDDSTDDDSADDDSTDDDSVDDDSADDDAGPTELLLMGNDGTDMASWLETAKGWTKQTLPPAVTAGFFSELGPSFFAEGEIGWTAWNVYGDAVTNGHDWLAYDPENGWDYDTKHLHAGGGAVIDLLFAADASQLWAASHCSMPFPLWERLWKYNGAFPVQQLATLGNPSFTAIFFPDDSSGLVSGFIGGQGFLYEYSARGWTEQNMPTGYEDGAFSWLALVDVDNGWGVWEGYNGGHVLMELVSGEWSEVTAPTGCEDYVPWQVFGREGYAITIDRSGPDNRFLEFRDGEWTCRNIGGGLYETMLMHALIRRDGRVFVAAQTEPGHNPLVYEVLDATLETVVLPVDLVEINGLHAIGPQAPRHSQLVAP